ncbi:MAG TPA: DNA repair protein RecN [Stenomitos sp.]
MLQRLRIDNFILIESLDLAFHAGLCVLTGETGAGKSIIIDAVGAILGGKAGPDTIRSGAERARLEGTFRLDPMPPAVKAWLADQGIEPAIEGELTLSREITPKGSRCRVEGVPVNQASLRALADALVDILGQHEHTLLTRPREHLGLLDRFGGPEVEALRAQVSRSHGRLASLGAEIRDLQAASAERERQRDFWQYQLAEIDEAHLDSETEEADLKAERTILANAEDLKRSLETVHVRLSEGEEVPSLIDGLGDVIASVRDAADVDPELTAIASSLDEALGLIEDASREIRRRSERLEADPERLHEVETRLDLLRDMLRKYGPTMSDLWAYRERIRKDLKLADTAGDRLVQLEAEREKIAKDLAQTATRLSASRREASGRLEAEIGRELSDLGMKDARFAVAFREHAEITAEGAEGAEFMLAPNPGEPPRPLAKTASGGELARLMLALKTVLVRADAVGTLIFDEVDTGISGRAAQVVAQKIASLGRRYQILLITHMPAIAAIADRHWHIEKRSVEGRTRLSVDLLDTEGQVRELAHLASGDSTSGAAVDHARELLAKASGYKQEAVI